LYGGFRPSARTCGTALPANKLDSSPPAAARGFHNYVAHVVRIFGRERLLSFSSAVNGQFCDTYFSESLFSQFWSGSLKSSLSLCFFLYRFFSLIKQTLWYLLASLYALQTLKF